MENMNIIQITVNFRRIRENVDASEKFRTEIEHKKASAC